MREDERVSPEEGIASGRGGMQGGEKGVIGV